MNEIEIESIAEAYIGYWSNRYAADDAGVIQKADKSQYEWANDRVMDLTYEAPEDLWEIILVVLSKSPSNEVMEILAAGPLEDYLSKLGGVVIEKVEQQAKLDPAFANLLGGVWKNDMSTEVWERVQKVWDRSGWDGNA
ncbi:hypothetical protein R50073_09310 [Maricurvus nonylphenolicus]|uniref:DUF6869 domain-containing protein n=1 Tax=Maricurvus nonylphenolicus TaxID=1008307 RepID=UPI0036F44BBF